MAEATRASIVARGVGWDIPSYTLANYKICFTMNPDKQKLLFERYPDIFRERDLPMTQTCLYWGIETDDGWFKLLDDLCSQLTLLKRYTGLDVVCRQCKSKLGTLRFYHHISAFPLSSTLEENLQWYSIVRALIAEAEQQSAQTCEETGEYGTMHISPTGWYRTLSPAKAAELGFKTREEWLRLRANEGDRNA